MADVVIVRYVSNRAELLLPIKWLAFLRIVLSFSLDNFLWSGGKLKTKYVANSSLSRINL